MSNIYQLSRELEALQSMLDGAEGEELEAIETTIGGISGEIGDQVESLVKFIKNIEGDVLSVTNEIDRLRARKSQMEARIGSIRDGIKGVMQASGMDKVRTALFSVTLAKGRESVHVGDESAIPDDYVTVKTVVNPDKKAIADAFKNGVEVPGCELRRGEPSIRIK